MWKSGKEGYASLLVGILYKQRHTEQLKLAMFLGLPACASSHGPSARPQTGLNPDQTGSMILWRIIIKSTVIIQSCYEQCGNVRHVSSVKQNTLQKEKQYL